MKRIGKISAIKKDANDSQIKTMQNQLMKAGYTRIPGTGVFKFPYKETSGKYRTGLDPDALYINRIQDETQRRVEIERVTKLRNKLQEALNVDLSPNSKFWNYSLAGNSQGTIHVSPAKLMDGDNTFDFTDPWKELTYAWLRVHPTIASSLQAYQRGEYPADTQFFVNDESIETEIVFKKKQAINKAIVKLDDMTPEKRKKVARIIGLPVSDESKEQHVYNLIDTHLKQTEIKSGKFQGLNPVEVFSRFADMDDKLLNIRDLIKQAVTHSIYRVKPSGRIYKGEAEVAKDEDELIRYLADDDNQSDYIELEEELKHKKMASI